MAIIFQSVSPSSTIPKTPNTFTLTISPEERTCKKKIISKRFGKRYTEFIFYVADKMACYLFSQQPPELQEQSVNMIHITFMLAAFLLPFLFLNLLFSHQHLVKETTQATISFLLFYPTSPHTFLIFAPLCKSKTPLIHFLALSCLLILCFLNSWLSSVSWTHTYTHRHPPTPKTWAQLFFAFSWGPWGPFSHQVIFPFNSFWLPSNSALGSFTQVKPLMLRSPVKFPFPLHTSRDPSSKLINFIYPIFGTAEDSLLPLCTCNFLSVS